METRFCAYSKVLAAAPVSPAPMNHLSIVSKFHLNFSSAFYFARVPELSPFPSNQFFVRRKAFRILLDTYCLFLEENFLILSILLEILTALHWVTSLGRSSSRPRAPSALSIREGNLENPSVP